MEFDQLSHRVIGCAIEAHRNLGPGLLESVYERCLPHELMLAGIPHECQVRLPVTYKDARLDCDLRVDVCVDRQLILELKSVEQFLPIYEAQLLTYMKLGKISTGLLINFNVPRLSDGIKRLVL